MLPAVAVCAGSGHAGGPRRTLHEGSWTTCLDRWDGKAPALAMDTKGVGRTRAKDCCAQIPIIRTATLAVRDSTLRHQSPGEEAVGRIGSKGVKGQAMTSMGDHGGVPVFEGLHEVSAQGFRVRARTRRLTR